MIKGFKEFIMRGNVIELAIAFVIGAAFAKVVDVFVGAIITPLLNAVGPVKTGGLGFAIKGENVATNPTFINISTLINALIVFLVTALVVYLALVLPMNKLAERKAAKRAAAGIIDPPEPASEQELLTQIRDLLQSQQQPSA
ncbi:MAG: large conductance mechanosensitive channel protein MscL [Actinomycetota bacterium]|nr:large conductance mechanosensitive channel protein MscL [Actinomycetota bacterium]